jgi:hypothetical protein
MATLLTATTIGVAITSESEGRIQLASITGLVANQTALYVDEELMTVRALPGGLNVDVFRGAGGTRAQTHQAGAVVLVGASNLFHGSDPGGTGAIATATQGYPWVNVNTGTIWNISNAKWIEVKRGFISTMVPPNATPGTVRAITGSCNPLAVQTSGNLVGVRGDITLPSAAAISGSYLYGVQGKIITGTGVFAGTSAAGVYGQLDVTGGTISGGHVACLQANIFGANAGGFAIEGIYIEHAGGGVINSFIQCFGKSDYVFDLASNTHVQMGTTGAASTAAGWLKLKVEGVVRYINLLSTAP